MEMTRSFRRRCRWLVLVFLTICLHARISEGQTVGRNSKSSGRKLEFDGGPPLYRTWLEQDVVWIITPEEKAAFKALQNDEQREDFVTAFWQRRNPGPDDYENEFKEEHYRRIAYANEHFGNGDPGWKTDRGRIYITYGKPDHVAAYSAQDTHPQAEDGQNYAGLPVETWSYRYLEGVGMDVVIDFVDICGCGDYRMRMPEEIRNALLLAPSELVGRRTEMHGPVDPEAFLKPPHTQRPMSPELEQMLRSSTKLQDMPLEIRTNSTKATDITSLVHFVMYFEKPGSSQGQEDSHPETLTVLARVRSLTGKVVEQFEDVVAADPTHPSKLEVQKSIALFNGYYRLEIAAETTHSKKVTYSGALVVRTRDDE